MLNVQIVKTICNLYNLSLINKVLFRSQKPPLLHRRGDLFALIYNRTQVTKLISDSKRLKHVVVRRVGNFSNPGIVAGFQVKMKVGA